MFVHAECIPIYSVVQKYGMFLHRSPMLKYSILLRSSACFFNGHVMHGYIKATVPKGHSWFRFRCVEAGCAIVVGDMTCSQHLHVLLALANEHLYGANVGEDHVCDKKVEETNSEEKQIMHA